MLKFKRINIRIPAPPHEWRVNFAGMTLLRLKGYAGQAEELVFEAHSTFLLTGWGRGKVTQNIEQRTPNAEQTIDRMLAAKKHRSRLGRAQTDKNIKI